MAKRSREPLSEEEKRALNASNLKKLSGIFRFIKPYRGIFFVGLLSLILSSATLLAFPYFAGKLLDVAQGKSIPVFNSVNDVAIALIVILFVQSIFSFTRVYTFSVTSEKTLADIRRALYHKMVWLPLRFFDERRVGELLSRITSDVSQLQDTFSFTLAELLRQVMTLTFGTILILYLAPKLTVFMLLTFPILVVMALIFGRYIRKLSRITQDKLATSNVIVEESLQSISVVKSFTNELFEIARYGKSLNEMVSVAIRTAKYRGLFISFAIFALFGGIVGVGWYGATLVQQQIITVGELFSFVIYTSFIGASIAGLGDIYAQLQRSIGASERIQEILAVEDEQSCDHSPVIKLQGDIAYKGVNFAYPTRKNFTVLDNLSLNVRAGEKVALVGQSGSGKSTIISLLMRFYDLDHGTITVDGKDIASYNLTSYRQNIGIVPQEVILFGGTIQENIAYGKPGATMDEIRNAAEQANALGFIDSFPEGFNTVVGERGVKLSGGQRQRIAIARAILKNPSILILDEATSSLDAESEYLVQEALEKLLHNRTSIIIAHRLSTIKKADKIFVIKEGKLAETGTHGELLQRDKGIYNVLLKLQLQEA